MKDDERSKQRVVCAAIKMHDGTIVCGARHFDSVMRATIKAMGKELGGARRAEQGFIDQFGAFLTRKEAMVIANDRGQIFRQCGNEAGDILYSEHLY